MASIFDIGDYLFDTFSIGKKSTDRAREAIESAGEEYSNTLQNIANNQKSAQELYNSGKETAANMANNKAGLAMKNAKAASMQTSGSKLLSAIQGAEAANKATQEGFDTTATQAANLQANQEALKTKALTDAAGARYNSTVDSAKLGAEQAQSRAKTQAGIVGNLGGAWLQLGKKE